MTERDAVKDKAALDAAASLCFDALEAAGRARTVAAEPKAKDAAQEAVQKANEAANVLIKAGAANPLFARRGRPQGKDVLNLSALAVMDTPAARELLDLLYRAVAVAEQVDAERGHFLAADFPLQPGETRGTDLAETLSELVLRVSREVNGARGRD